MLQDIRHALRLMARQKAFSTAALATLALGIGAATAIFSMVYGVLLRPLPYANADRLVRLSEEHPGGTSILPVPMLSQVTFHAWRSRARTLEGIAAYSGSAYTLTDAVGAVRIAGTAVSPELFSMLGVQPVAGRLLHPQDGAAGAPDVVVLGYSVWHQRFGGDSAAIGRSVTLDGKPFTIVGVAPPDFFFPTRSARLWTVYRVPRVQGEDATARLRVFSAVGLLRPGITPSEAAAEGTGAARGTEPRHLSADLLFGKGGPVTVRAQRLLDEMTARIRPALLVIMAAVGLVLLMACANVANLLLSRGVVRERELAVRAALGAGRARLVRHLLADAFILAAAGGVLGVIAASAFVEVLPLLAPANLPRLEDVRLDAAVFAFTAIVSIAAGVLSGVVPALRLVQGQLAGAIRDGAGGTHGARAQAAGAALLAAEAALALVLLVGAGLLGLSFARLMQVDPGFRAADVLTALVYLPPGADQEERSAALRDRLLERLRGTRGVIAAGAANMAPLVPNTSVRQMTLRGDAAEPVTVRALAYVMTPGYLDALGVRLRAGRLLTEEDRSPGVRRILVNDEFVRMHLDDGAPVVGRRFTDAFELNVDIEIVGVVANVLKDGLDSAPRPEMYAVYPEGTGPLDFFNVAIRTSAAPAAMAPILRTAVREIEPAAAVDDVTTLEERVAKSVGEPRFASVILAVFAAAALALAAVGLYGVQSYQVSQRRREMGIRAALGASPASIVRLVVGEGMAVTLAGLAAGALAAAWLGRLLQGLLFGVTPHDPYVFAGAAGVLTLVALAASLLPARRAASVDPIDALKYE